MFVRICLLFEQTGINTNNNPTIEKENIMTFWFITGSQFLYGEETLAMVEKDAKEIVAGLRLPFPVEYKLTAKTSREIEDIIKQANFDDDCAGIITFCHTFSPSKMWINGLAMLQKPWLHLHTQYNRAIPNEEIDMDYMNLHQSAHGDREHGFIGARLRAPRRVVAGYWKDEKTQQQIADWQRSAVGIAFSKQLKIVRFGDNMREVAVTEGDKVEAQIRFGWQVNTCPVGRLAEVVSEVSEEEVDRQMEAYHERYEFHTQQEDAVRYQAREEVAIRSLLNHNGCGAFVTNFQDLFGLRQLPGLAAQDLMREGYGFGAEGDWKVAAMLAVIDRMSKDGGHCATFMEYYTYHLSPQGDYTLGSHMLEVDPSYAGNRWKGGSGAACLQWKGRGCGDFLSG